MNLRKVLAIKPFQITHQIHKGYASFFVMSFSSRPLQIFTKFNCRFKVHLSIPTLAKPNYAKLPCSAIDLQLMLKIKRRPFPGADDTQMFIYFISSI